MENKDTSNILICIDDVTDILKFGDGIRELTYGRAYKVTRWFETKSDGRQFISIRNDKDALTEYLTSRFLSKEDFLQLERDKKLNKLLNI